MAEGVLVFVEERQGVVRKASLESVSAAREIADALEETVTALCIGSSNAALQLARCGADRILIAQHNLLGTYSTEAYTTALADAAERLSPRIILGAATSMGRDLLPRLAARLRSGLAQDCTGIRIVEGERLECTRPIYAGKALATVRPLTVPALATLRPNVFPMRSGEQAREVTTEEFTPCIDAGRVRARVVATEARAGQKVELTEAAIIVSGGRGVKGPENFPMIQKLADVLSGAMGASRAAVDAGWIDHQHQVGQTGKTVSPTLYIACGISGAVQHLAGMSSSKYVVAINKDPEAPIFKIADYGIVGDIFEVVPALTEAIVRLRSQ
ncbi:MAG: electron transfer flavoprotein subunit alpha/FixB family protein [Acidobacteria bacterium]|nr:electron transfer flavoprotein subunit alpha/FixB family protein [Acidobacteriota bacterium]